MPLKTIGTATGIVLNTFTQNIGIKSFGTLTIMFLDKLLVGQEFWICLMFIMYFLDFLVGLVLAFNRKEFSLKKFFFGSSKLLIYGIYLVMGMALGEILGWGNILMLGIISFTILTDSISILRKLDALGYETPVFLTKYLISYKDKLENGKFGK